MRNFNESDYALNKFSKGIVYKFADGKQEITLEQYLQSNPSKTEQDFLELKALSDEIYHEQEVQTHRTGRLDVTINGMEDSDQLATISLDTELIQKQDAGQALKAAQRLMNSGHLTEVQKRRFIFHYIQGYSTRQIGRMEGVSHKNVLKSIQLAKEKLKTFFEK